MANLNKEQAATAATLMIEHPGPIRIESAPGGQRYLTININHDDEVRYHLDLDGEVQGAMPR